MIYKKYNTKSYKKLLDSIINSKYANSTKLKELRELNKLTHVKNKTQLEKQLKIYNTFIREQKLEIKASKNLPKWEEFKLGGSFKYPLYIEVETNILNHDSYEKNENSHLFTIGITRTEYLQNKNNLVQISKEKLKLSLTQNNERYGYQLSSTIINNISIKSVKTITRNKTQPL